MLIFYVAFRQWDEYSNDYNYVIYMFDLLNWIDLWQVSTQVGRRDTFQM